MAQGKAIAGYSARIIGMQQEGSRETMDTCSLPTSSRTYSARMDPLSSFSLLSFFLTPWSPLMRYNMPDLAQKPAIKKINSALPILSGRIQEPLLCEKDSRIPRKVVGRLQVDMDAYRSNSLS